VGWWVVAFDIEDTRLTDRLTSLANGDVVIVVLRPQEASE